MIKKPTEDEWLIYEILSYPIGFSEVMFSDVDNLSFFNDEMSDIRLYQHVFFSYESMHAEDEEATDRENFQRRKNAGDGYIYAGRGIGKTICVSKLDLVIYAWWFKSETCGFSSYDAAHVERVLEGVAACFEGHVIIKELVPRIKRSPFYFKTVYGVEIFGINTNKYGRSPGGQFVGHHFHRVYIEEASEESEKIAEHRAGSYSDFSAVIRCCGMTNFTKHTPAGKIFYDSEFNRFRTVYPAFVSEIWTKEKEAQAVKEYGGKEELGYKIYVEAEIVEDGISTFDIARIREGYLQKKQVTYYEVSKDNYRNFYDFLYLEVPNNVTSRVVTADIGEGITEIAIIYKVNEEYHLCNNIRLINLIEEEQFEVFKFIINSILASHCYNDATGGTGKILTRKLAKEFLGRCIVGGVSFNEKIRVDFQRNEKGEIIFDTNGQPVYKDEYMPEWSVIRLKHLLYGKILRLPYYERLEKQLNSVVVLRTGLRTVYTLTTSEDHLYQAIQCFAIAQWIHEFENIQPRVSKVFAKSGV